MIYCSFIEAVQLYQEESAAKVRAVGQSEVGAISSLTVRSSAQWGDSDEFQEVCREKLPTAEAQIGATDHAFWVCAVEEEIAGCYALEILSPEAAELEAMFVAPKMMGRGIGRTLIERAKKEAAALAIKRLTIQGDANATDSCAAAGGS